MKLTKKPKTVKVKWNEETFTKLLSEYRCPVCRTIYIGTIEEKVTRFNCDCEQELIVK